MVKPLIGAYQWYGKATLEGYNIGFNQGYSTGISDAATPGAEVIQVSPDGKLVSRKKNS